MKTLHFDCFSGISGDMTLGALIDAGVDAGAIRAALDSLGLPVQLNVEKVRKGGFAATQVWVRAPEEKAHRHLPDIEEIIARGALTPAQRELALRIFRRLGEAEAEAHGIPLERVHFHEVGALDSIADIVGAAVALDLLGAEHVTCRSVPTGQGTVKCEHGVMPVPTPATAALLRGVPLASSPIKAELTTPTGAAILATVVNEWTDSPALTVERVGHGAGMKDFLDQPNLLRVFVGTTASASDRVWVLETNLDDVPGEVVGYCFERLLAAGALDVYAIPVQMKKQRPGVMLGVIAAADKVAALEAVLFAETGTFGVRRYQAERSVLRREAVTVSTPWGPVPAKRGWRDGVEVVTPEYEGCAAAARAAGVPLRAVYDAVRRADRG
ncbi:MAG: nickel pincer cofactor biosynthesis protein LarC [Gemmataceae bacterium]